MKKGIVCMILAAFMLTGCKDKVNYIEQGTQQMEEQQYEEAVSSFQKSLEEKEDAAEAYRGLGMAYYEQQDYEAAKEAFQTACPSLSRASIVNRTKAGCCLYRCEDAGADRTRSGENYR